MTETESRATMPSAPKRVDLPATAAWRHHDARLGFEVLFLRHESDRYHLDGHVTTVAEGEPWGIRYTPPARLGLGDALRSQLDRRALAIVNAPCAASIHTARRRAGVPADAAGRRGSTLSWWGEGRQPRALDTYHHPFAYAAAGTARRQCSRPPAGVRLERLV